MNVQTAALRITQALEQAGVPYLVVGGFSSNVYGLPRATKDVDVVVSIKAHSPALPVGG